jgi:hypothetical protein
MRRKKTKEENRIQAEAFGRMNGNALELIPQYASDFREIITEYESTHEGHVPSADELLWIESQRKGRDITE